MAKTKLDVEQFKTEAVKSLYAVAGATELAVEAAQGRVAKIDLEPRALPKSLPSQALAVVNSRVAGLQKDAKDAQAKVEARLAEALEDLTATYGDLADRGERFVSALRKEGVKAVAKARPTSAAAAKKAPATAPAAKKAPAKKAAATRATAKKTTAQAS